MLKKEQLLIVQKKNVFHVEQTWKELKGLSKKKTLGDLCEKYTHQT